MSDNDSRVWQDAHVGAASPQVAVRVTEDEKERLEELRQELRLTSKGQVVRVALDFLERFLIAGAALGVPTDEKNWREAVDVVRRGATLHQIENLKRNGLAAGEAGASGLPADTAPLGPTDDRQLELPEMPQGATNAA